MGKRGFRAQLSTSHLAVKCAVYWGGSEVNGILLELNERKKFERPKNDQSNHLAALGTYQGEEAPGAAS